MTTRLDDERILVFILAYNEQNIISKVVEDVRDTVPQADVLVIDDGSTDQTSHAARSAGARVIRHPFNLGIGGAMQTGLKFAQHQGYAYAIRMDGDGQHSAAEIAKLLSALSSQSADLVIGSRFLESTFDWKIPAARRMGIRLYSAVVSAVIGAASTDTTSGFCGMNRSAMYVLAEYLPQDYPDVESRIIVHKAGLTQLELPVSMRARAAGTSSIDLGRSIYYAFKVTVAAITSAIKEIALYDARSLSGQETSQEKHHADSLRTKDHRGSLQSYPPIGDAPTDPYA